MTPQTLKKQPKSEQDRNEEVNNARRQPDVRSETVPEAHFEAPKDYGRPRSSDGWGSFGALGNP